MDSAQEPEPRPGGVTCDEAVAAMGRFLSSGFRITDDVEAQEAMRAHIQECDECAETYRRGVETTSAMKGALRAQRLREVRAAQGGRPRLGGLGAMGVLMSWGGKQPSNKVARTIWRLRPILLVAFFFWLMVWITKPGGPGPAFRLEWQAGLVVAGSKQIQDDLPNFGLADGQRLVTDGGGRAVLSRLETEVSVGPSTELECVRVVPLELYLHGGELALVATGQVTSDRCVVVLEEASARLQLDPEALEVRCDAGVVLVTLSDGEHRLEAGQGLIVDRQGARPAPLPTE